MLLNEFQISGFKIKVLDSLNDEKTAKKWKEVASSAIHLRPEMLILLEKAKPLDLHFRYLFIYQENDLINPCGVIYFQLLHFNHRNFYFENKNILHYVALFILRITSFRVLLAGCLFSVDFTPLVVDEKKVRPEALLQILEEYSKIEKYDLFVLKDMPERFDKSILSEFNYSPFETDLTMQLELNPEWKSFGDYEKALTHKYAQRVRKIRKQGSLVNRKQIKLQEFWKYREKIKQLFLQVSQKQTIRMGIVDDVYFEELFKALGEDFSITGYFINDNMVAFSSHIYYPEKLEVHYIGIDYEFNRDYSLYFNILYDGIELALKHSKKSLELGRTAREAKAVAGCHPIYFNDYLKVRNRLIRWMLNLLRTYFNKSIGEGWKKRHPFKTIATNVAEK